MPRPRNAAQAVLSRSPLTPHAAGGAELSFPGGSEPMVHLIERDSVPLAPDTFLSVPYAAGDYHIDPGAMRQFQQFFHPLAVKSLQRAGIVSFSGHGNHERLGGEGAGFVDRDAHIALRDFAHHGAEKADAPGQQSPESPQNTAAARIEERHQLSIV